MRELLNRINRSLNTSKKFKSVSVNLEELLKELKEDEGIQVDEDHFKEEFEVMVMDPCFKPKDKTILKLFLFDSFFFILKGKKDFYDFPNHRKIMQIDSFTNVMAL